MHVGLQKEGDLGTFTHFTQLENFKIQAAVSNIINQGDRYNVPGDLSTQRKLLPEIVIATAATMLFSLNAEGAGIPVE